MYSNKENYTDSLVNIGDNLFPAREGGKSLRKHRSKSIAIGALDSGPDRKNSDRRKVSWDRRLPFLLARMFGRSFTYVLVLILLVLDSSPF